VCLMSVHNMTQVRNFLPEWVAKQYLVTQVEYGTQTVKTKKDLGQNPRSL